MVLNGRRTFNAISEIVGNSVLVPIQNSVKGFFEKSNFKLLESSANQLGCLVWRHKQFWSECYGPVSYLSRVAPVRGGFSDTSQSNKGRLCLAEQDGLATRTKLHECVLPAGIKNVFIYFTLKSRDPKISLSDPIWGRDP